ncbi:MAG: DNA alkylation repair protein [Bacteroidales bacterium]|nr:DNA alkylation repair protein [Bacteroidales bacterium]MDT8432662.1 DNA alkylation repair protein [Bacteroidales bacterium]
MRENVVANIRKALNNHADQKTADSSQRFFKEGEKALVHGVKSAEVRRIGKEFFRHIKALPKKEIFELCEELWKSQYLEEAVIACVWSEAQHKKYEPSDFEMFQHWVEVYVNNWAACDTLCNHTIGTFIMMYPEYIRELKKWANSPNRWVRRASAVTLIIPARKGMFLGDIFEIADILLPDQDHMVQKGYGWMLKVASQAHEREVFEYVVSKKAVMPRTALRYAIEKMPVQLRTEAMRK